MTGNLLYTFRLSVLGWCIAQAPLECSNVVQNYSTKPNNLERRLTNLVETSKFVSLSCLLWRLSAPFFSTNGKYKACSFAWAVELSSSFVVKLKQRCSSYQFSPFHDFWRILRHFLLPLTHSHINILWVSIRGIILQNLSASNPVYVVYIIYGIIIPDGRFQVWKEQR